MHALIQLTENDKRIIIAIFLVLILLLVLVGYIGYWITRIMDSQGRKLDTKCYDVVTTRVITNKKVFRAYARKKNWQMFYKSAQIPMIIMLSAGLCILLHFLINGFNVNLFDPHKGFSSMLFLWDFKNIPTTQFFGWKIICGWPPLYEDIGKPVFVPEAIPSYIGVIALAVGFLWYLVCVQALIARGLRIRKLCDSIFEKSLEGFNQNNQAMGIMGPGPVVPPQPQAPQNQQPLPPGNDTNLKL